MLPVQFEVGTDVYRATTVRGPYPPFDSAWRAVWRAHSLFRAALPTLLKAVWPVLLVNELLAVLIMLSCEPDGCFPLYFLGVCAVDALVNTWLAGATQHVAWAQVEGRRVAPAEARRVGVSLLGRMLVARLAYGAWVFCGYCVMFLPALYCLGSYALVEPAVYFERASVGAALGRSAQLTNGSIGRVLVAMVLSLGVLAACLAPAVLVHTVLGRGPQFMVAFVLGRLALSLFSAYGGVLRTVIYLGLARDHRPRG